MSFELTDALLQEILFSMENQDNVFLLDTREGVVVSAGDIEEADCEGEPGKDRFIPLPGWSPQDGYRVMERFAAGLHNPMIREQLTAALNQGRGVFRAFKDVLAQHPQTEKLWFAFKDRAMKREVIAWYNSYREIRGLELLGGEPEDTSSLILEDFLLREGTESDYEKADALHKLCLGAGDDAGLEVFQSMNQWAFPGDLCFIAETLSGDFSGYICAVRSAPLSLHICALEVSGEYRGLGLGKALLGRFLEKAGILQIRNITVDLPGETDNFSRALLMEHFKPCVQRYLLTLNNPQEQ
ncbi:MAG: UPF0158 family protein [Treponema sp.]|nr:UPF0158 family protein [Treponema sp.]